MAGLVVYLDKSVRHDSQRVGFMCLGLRSLPGLTWNKQPLRACEGGLTARLHSRAATLVFGFLGLLMSTIANSRNTCWCACSQAQVVAEATVTMDPSTMVVIWRARRKKMHRGRSMGDAPRRGWQRGRAPIVTVRSGTQGSASLKLGGDHGRAGVWH